jgi:hypothetical protein
MKFEATKCDECGRILQEANHWVLMRVWVLDGFTVGIALGSEALARNGLMGVSDFTRATTELHDLCGQGCAVKHLAKLLRWSQIPPEAQYDAA